MSIPTTDLRALEKKYRQQANDAHMRCVDAFGPFTPADKLMDVTIGVLNELHVVIVKAETQVEDAEQRIAAVLELCDHDDLKLSAEEQDKLGACPHGVYIDVAWCFACRVRDAALGASPAPPKEGE